MADGKGLTPKRRKTPWFPALVRGEIRRVLSLEFFLVERYHKDSSFYGWIFNMPCFIIDDNIEAIHAKKVEHGYNLDHNKERVSEFVDEWHVKDIIPLDKIKGIALPFD